MYHNDTMKMIMLLLLVVIGVLVIGGVLLLRQTSQGTNTYQNSAQTIPSATPEAIKSTSSLPSVMPTSVVKNAGIKLTVSSPVSGATVTKASLTVRGTTTKGADISVNETDTLADQNGNFSAVITLDEGENLVFVVASDSEGNYAEEEISVTYDTGVSY